MSLFNTLVVKSLPLVPKSIVKSVASRYIAGAHLSDAVATVQRLDKLGARSTVDVLGEFVSSRERAVHECAASSSVIDAIQTHNLPAYLSVKLTSLGLDIDDSFCYANIRGLVEKAHNIGSFVRLDMENSPYTTRTLDIYRKIRAEGFTNIGVVIQAYMHRSEQDIRELATLNADVRLCKGIYIEDSSIAFRERTEIQNNYKKLLRLLVEHNMNVHIATHDDVLIDDARDFIAKNNIAKDTYEFQMLLGVREEKRDAIIKEGHGMRIYVPFGEDWYGYSTRRLKENPQVAGYVMKAMFTGGK
ncbi:MAG: proline dehydrogenase family protein [Candidatus Kapaibacterium sp.]|nr:proline dehydrogenase family protein [Bacteroidota bacterium]